MIELITAAATLAGSLASVIVKAINARQEDEVNILAEAQAAAGAFQQAIDGLSAVLLMNDHNADSALAAKFDMSEKP